MKLRFDEIFAVNKTTERLCTTAQWTFLHILRAFLVSVLFRWELLKMLTGLCRALAVPGFCVAMMALVLCFEGNKMLQYMEWQRLIVCFPVVAITIQYYHRWKRIKNSFPLLAPRRPSTTLIFRVGLFFLYSWVALMCVGDDLRDLRCTHGEAGQPLCFWPSSP